MATSNPLPRLVTERLVIEVPDPDAAPRVAAYFRDNEAHFARTSPPRPTGFTTPDHWTVQLARGRREAEEGSSLRLYVRLRDDPAGRVIGNIGFSRMVRLAFLCCTMGYGIDARYEGRGLMYEATSAAIHHVFDALGFHRVEANHLPDNLRSAHLLRRLGFVVEGYAREYLYIDGAWRDHVLNALSNPEVRVPVVSTVIPPSPTEGG